MSSVDPSWSFLTIPGARHDLAHFIGGFFLHCLTLTCWSWTGGFVVGSLSRRTTWLNGVLFSVVLFAEFLAMPQDRNPFADAVFSLTLYNLIFPLTLRTVLVLVPSLWGMHKGLRVGTLPLFQTILWAVAIATVTAMVTGSLQAADAQLAAIESNAMVTAQATGSLLNAGIWGWLHLRAGWQLRLLPLAVLWPAGYMVVTSSCRRWRGRTAPA